MIHNHCQCNTQVARRRFKFNGAVDAIHSLICGTLFKLASEIFRNQLFDLKTDVFTDESESMKRCWIRYGSSCRSLPRETYFALCAIGQSINPPSLWFLLQKRCSQPGSNRRLHPCQVQSVAFDIEP